MTVSIPRDQGSRTELRKLKDRAEAVSRLIGGIQANPASVRGLARVAERHARIIAEACAKLREGEQ